MLPQGCQYLLDVSKVIRHRVRPDYYIVQIDMTELADEGPKGCTHPPLVSRWGVSAPHGHDQPFIESEWCSHHREMNIVRVHTGLKERVCHVNFPPDLSL